MKLRFAGAAQTVTGSQTVVSHYSHSVLIDCGMFQGPRELRDYNWNKPDYVHEIKDIIITHAHIDHSGLLPKWASWGWKGKIYCSKSTADLLTVMLIDSAKLQEEDAFFANKTKHSSHDPALPLYTMDDAVRALEMLYPVEFDVDIPLSPNMSFKFLRAGHILGSAIVNITYSNGNGSKHLTFSGDLGGGHSDLIKEPVTLSETDDLVLESTYGNRKVDVTKREEELAKVVNKVIKRKGTLVIPAFALGRTQDLLYSLYKLHKENKIVDVPVYLDSPMANTVTRVYLKHLNELQFDPKKNHIEESLSPSFFHKIESPDESMVLCMSEEPKIVLSASGMLQGGRVLHHLKHKLSDEKSGVLFVGFQGAATKGRLLQEGILTLRIHHTEIPVEAEIFTLEGYSAHADSDDIMKWLESIQNKPKRIFLNHGEIESQTVFADRIKAKFPKIEVIIPKMHDIFELS